MDVTRRSDYALRMLRATYRERGSYRSVAQIAQEEGIPYAFARSIQHDLVEAGLLSTVRGAKGGTALAVDPCETTMLQVLEAVGGPLSIAPCSEEPAACAKQPECAFNKLWQGADALVSQYFGSITLSDILEQGASNAVVSRALASDS